MPDPGAATIGAVVIYARPHHAHALEVRVPAGSSVRQAIEASGIVAVAPELAGQQLDVGVFGQACSLDGEVHDGDRIEIYRPLQVDPKQARRSRAAKHYPHG